MGLDLLNGPVEAEIPDRRSVALRHVQGERLVALLSREGLAETPFGRHQLHRAILGEVHVPREAVEGNGQTGIQAGHSEEG